MNKHRKETLGDYPQALVKLFEKREYAEQFLAGSIRLTLLDNYKTIEDASRKDTGEGKGAFAAPAESVTSVHLDENGEVVGQSEAPGDMNYQIHGGTVTYVLCCTDPDGADIDRLKEKFGQYVVRINDPVRLGQALTDRLSEVEDAHPLAGQVVVVARVAYDKGQRRKAEPNADEIFRASFSQKDASFAEENEVRLVVFHTKHVERDKAEQVISIDIDPLDYAELITSDSDRSTLEE